MMNNLPESNSENELFKCSQIEGIRLNLLGLGKSLHLFAMMTCCEINWGKSLPAFRSMLRREDFCLQ